MRTDVFCKVVDNYGDAAVCWRLARQLAQEHGHAVRLWIDDPGTLAALCPALDRDRVAQAPGCSVEGVQVRSWATGVDWVAAGRDADLVIEAFGCGLPEAYAESLAAAAPGRCLWIVLEYLSAEAWVPGHHGLPSPHPRLPIPRHYFFPGVAPGTGGVLREAGFDARQAGFSMDPHSTQRFWQGLGFAPQATAGGGAATRVSLFGYENTALVPLLDDWARGPSPVVAAVTAGRVQAQVVAWLAGQGVEAATLREGGTVRRGALELRLLPFLPQPAYDELLWACDLNFVRGEDSFVRAQWAARPFVWQPYVQAEGAHLAKLAAFLTAYGQGLAPGAARALQGFSALWNAGTAPRDGAMGEAWAALRAAAPELGAQARAWAGKLHEIGDLAGNLDDFCRKRLK